MKLKFMLVPLVVLGFIIGCVNNQPELSIGSKWFSPTEKQLIWKKADRVCRDNEGRLPTIEELKEVVIDCGGTVTTNLGKIPSKNSANKIYQSCYKEKGFRSSSYWSSTSIVGDDGNAWVVDFNIGYVYLYPKNFSNYVRCVRAGQ